MAQILTDCNKGRYALGHSNNSTVPERGIVSPIALPLNRRPRISDLDRDHNTTTDPVHVWPTGQEILPYQRVRRDAPPISYDATKPR